jgi:hypothetical protein
MRIHDECKTPEELKKAADKARWNRSWKERSLADGSGCDGKRGRKPVKPLDPTVERVQPLLVVTKPLSLADTMHRYVASVLVECNGDFTATRRTLRISSHSLRRCIRRIEAGTAAVRKCNPVSEMRDYKAGTKQ